MSITPEQADALHKAVAADLRPRGVEQVEPVCKSEQGCHRVAPCDPGCGTRDLLAEARAANRGAADQTGPSRRAGLRDQLRRAACEAEGFAWDSDMLEPDEYGDHADSVLAVLYQEWPWLRAEHAAAVASCPGYEASPNPCRCPCYGCKHHCGAHNPENVSVEAERPALRDRIADAIRAAACTGDCGLPEEECARTHVQPGVWHHGVLAEVEGTPEAIADAVLAVQRLVVDWAAVLRELEQRVRPNTPPSRPEPRRTTDSPVKQRADCTELEWAEQERARFERLYTRESVRADKAEAEVSALRAAHAAEAEQLREQHKASLRHADQLNNELMEEVQRYTAGTERPVLWSVYNAMHLRALDAETKAGRLAAENERPLSPYFEHPECGFRWHGRDGMDVPMRDGQPVCPRCELRRVNRLLDHRERRNDELRAECKRRGKNVLEYAEKAGALERDLDHTREQLGAEILRSGQAEAELRRMADEARDPGPSPRVAQLTEMLTSQTGCTCHAPADIQTSAAASEPTPLRWGLDDIEYGDDDTTTVMLSGPHREPYYLDLDQERANALRDALAGPESADTVRPTRYTVNLLPETDINGHVFEITVEYRGASRWAVLRHGQCLGADGAWDYEMRPSEREDDWLDTHRFDLDTALRFAQEQAPLITVNGLTAADALRRLTGKGEA